VAVTVALAIVSVVSGAAVAIVVPWITSALERRRLRQQVAESRIDELRAVLDEAAIALGRARSALPTWEVLAQEPDMVGALAESRRAIEAVGAQTERIAVRLGERSEVFSGYNEAQSALWKLHHHLAAENTLEKIPGVATGERLNPDEDHRFLEGRRTFREASRAIVGPDVIASNRPPPSA
jgi:hypothetical protein